MRKRKMRTIVVAIAMSSEVWNKDYKSDNTFFGNEPSNFALLCFNHMKMNDANKVLELGAGHDRDTIFFASNGLEVGALDYSVAAVEILDKIAKEKRLLIKPRIFDVRSSLPFQDAYFDAIYSHMLLPPRQSVLQKRCCSFASRSLSGK
jgi:SAM-dependent methyltransferase